MLPKNGVLKYQRNGIQGIGIQGIQVGETYSNYKFVPIPLISHTILSKIELKISFEGNLLTSKIPLPDFSSIKFIFLFFTQNV